jgi:cell wall-associated NlpC family hydrolase
MENRSTVAMTDISTSAPRRPLSLARRALVVLIAGAGVALSPLPASAHVSGPLPPPSVPAGPIVAPTRAAQVAVNTALAQLGDPYVWAAAGPDAFDCSGLTQYVYAAAGVSLPHSSSMQSAVGRPVAYADLKPGDLVFFYHPVGHVGIYIGNGQMIHAPHTGDVVKIVDLAYMPDYVGARRIA